MGILLQMTRKLSSLYASPQKSNGPLYRLNLAIQEAIKRSRKENESRPQKLDLYRSELIGKSSKNRVQQELRSISGGVKSHEQSHLAALGSAAAGPIQYSYVTGPGGERFAVGGSIKVDLRPVPGNPEETIRKAQKIRRAAMSPGSPSAADRRVAAKAYLMEARARRELEAEENTQRVEIYA